ncbi:hypothetical protein BDQ94DRAFT_148475 [Aspergillus welwitschiae]|uniref:Uncharacterized protein n=1 Tax=Aspergillus welwitschiae TaxID=1341132 RepID=A0A3F3PU28_9EURO|nr:hypothetical protein BDQ94DRAFT_148475 [Aspergillus welwitschiae]RDH30461.1 hypothetical protein BDQ94DRAFT_148475 [Aspergillus welwitschiae]
MYWQCIYDGMCFTGVYSVGCVFSFSVLFVFVERDTITSHDQLLLTTFNGHSLYY